MHNNRAPAPSIPTACRHCGGLVFAHPRNTHGREPLSTLRCISCSRELGVLIGRDEHREYDRRLAAERAALMAQLDASDLNAIADGAVAAAKELAGGQRAERAA